MRYDRSEVIRWLNNQGCSFDSYIVGGIIFFDANGNAFTVPDDTDDGWLWVDLVDDALNRQWSGLGTLRPTTYP